MQQLFRLLLEEPNGLHAKEALARLQERVTLTPYEQGEYASGGRRFEKIVRFATVDCVRAGWFVKEKGRWMVTEQGKQALETFPAPAAFYREASRLYRIAKSLELEEAGSSEEISDEVIEQDVNAPEAKATSITYDRAEEEAWAAIEKYLGAMNPYDFQKLVAALLRGMGYHVAWIAPPGKDGGVDIVAWTDPLGTKPPRIKVQVKREVQSISVDGLRAFMATLGDGDVGLFVSLGGFTKDATDKREPKSGDGSLLLMWKSSSTFGLSTISRSMRLSDVACRFNRFGS